MSKYSRKKRARMNREDARGRALSGLLSTVHVAPTQVTDDAPRETLASYTAEYNRQEEEARLAPIRAAEQALNESLRALRKEQCAALLTTPSEELNQTCLPFVHKGETGEELMATATAAFNQFKNDLLTEGITFTPAAGNKLAKVSALNLNLNWVDVATVRQIFEYCDSLGLWDESEVIRPKAPTAQVDTGLTLDKIETLDTTSQETRRASESAVNEYFYTREVAPVWEAWTSHMVRDYGFYPTEDQGRAIIDWFVKFNRNMRDTREWDRMRVALRATLGPSPRTGQAMLTSDELLGITLQDADFNDYETKQQFLRTSRRVNG